MDMIRGARLKEEHMAGGAWAQEWSRASLVWAHQPATGRQGNKGLSEDRQTDGKRSKKVEWSFRLPETVELRPKPDRTASASASSSLPVSPDASCGS